MELQIDGIDKGTITKDHPTASYGYPVLVVDGAAYGPLDVMPDGEKATNYVAKCARIEPSNAKAARWFCGTDWDKVICQYCGDPLNQSSVTGCHMWPNGTPHPAI